MEYSFFIYGIPRPKQSMKLATRKNRLGNTYIAKMKSPDVAKAELSFQQQILLQLPTDFAMLSGVPLEVQYRFKFPYTAGLKKTTLYRTKRPDLGNLTKLVDDAMEGIIYSDDSLIVRYRAEKVYSAQPGIDITVTVIENEHTLLI
jgi:Holliday junction resolvase RusA-like endonuclease